MNKKKPNQKHMTISGHKLEDFYDSSSLDSGWSENVSLGSPGEFPFTRGVYPNMYRGKLWTMRQFAGYGSPEDTNKRFKYLISQGITGLSTAFDMPTLMGYDADHELSRGEVGREGVSVSSIEDMERLFDGIDISKVSTSMTINCSAAPILAMYFAIAKRRGVPMDKLRGTIQNDILKEFIAQKEWISPPEPSVKINCDVIEYCSQFAPSFHPVSISGYHIREAGSTAIEELAFTLYNGISYVEECVSRGLKIEDFAPRLSFFFDVHNSFFEEIAKFRAARRMWAHIIKDRFKCDDKRSQMLKMHTQTAGVSLTAQQPMNNVARVAIQALAAVLGGTQSLHTNSMDETLSLPTEEAVTLALRTQQILAEETSVDAVADPLGGSYYIENLTDEIEREANKIIGYIDNIGGMVSAINEGYPQSKISESAYDYHKRFESEDYKVVGVNSYTMEEETKINIHKVDPEVEKIQINRLSKFKQNRCAKTVASHLELIKQKLKNSENIMTCLINAVDDGVTTGEVCDCYREVHGVYSDPGFF